MITLQLGELITLVISAITLLATMIATWRSVAQLKKDLMAQLKTLVCIQIDEKIKPFAENQLDVLRCSIIRAHNAYKTEGLISRYVLQSVEELFTDYKALSGNGFVDTLMNELRQLPEQRQDRHIHDTKVE
jgi:hypothetical protein